MEAILIKPLGGGRSFNDVQGQIKNKAKPEQTKAVIKSINRTQNGYVLIKWEILNDKALKAPSIF